MRVFSEECDAIRKELRDAGPARMDDAIHSARKRMKKLRGLLRLLRPALGERIYARENRNLRDLARRLAPPRDAFVMVRTWERFAGRTEKGSSSLGSHLRLGVGEMLKARYALARIEVVDQRAEPRSVADLIRGVAKRSPAWPLDGLEEGDLLDGLRAQYRRARKAMKQALAHPSFENRHDWRKQVKYLWHQIELIAPIRTGPLKSMIRRLNDLSDLLGEDHDLAVLQALLEPEAAEGRIGADEWTSLQARIGRRQERLCTRAARLGRRVLEPGPRDFLRAIGRSLRRNGGSAGKV